MIAGPGLPRTLHLAVTGGLRLALPGLLAAALGGCGSGMPAPIAGLEGPLAAVAPSRSPSLAGRWLALIGERNGREQVLLIDVERRLPVPLSGLNRPDALPISVSVDAAGDRLAVVRQIEDRTELVLHRRGLGGVERIAMQPAGVPRRVALRADGRELAVEVSRDGRWQIDLIAVP
ncbi:MAG: TolB family protein [Cyanobium sp.]